MKINTKIQSWLIWTGVGLVSLVIIGIIISLQLTSIEEHYPIHYGAEPYTNDFLTKTCKK